MNFGEWAICFRGDRIWVNVANGPVCLKSNRIWVNVANGPVCLIGNGDGGRHTLVSSMSLF